MSVNRWDSIGTAPPQEEDCAQANGASIEGQKVGTFGDMAVFSFQMNKNRLFSMPRSMPEKEPWTQARLVRPEFLWLSSGGPVRAASITFGEPPWCCIVLGE
ncbi:MAG TPA: DegT/DnrJ/EryC1/StrS family aminotransferase [Terriglobales bacterium]|nr:DegT/DnrJ/EryC1/StrS family aminotransferase [Terriglobales bacterium]